MSAPARVILCTCPDDVTAERLARMLVDARLAACVNLLHPARSIYRWQENVETATETLMVIKTTAAAWPELAQRLAEAHPYEVPEIISVQITDGLPTYLQWIDSCVTAS